MPIAWWTSQHLIGQMVRPAKLTRANLLDRRYPGIDIDDNAVDRLQRPVAIPAVPAIAARQLEHPRTLVARHLLDRAAKLDHMARRKLQKELAQGERPCLPAVRLAIGAERFAPGNDAQKFVLDNARENLSATTL